MQNHINVIFFSILLFISLYLKSTLFAFIVLFFFYIYQKHYLLPILIFTPIIETVLVATQGVTISKIVIIIFSLSIIIQIYKDNAIYKIDYFTSLVYIFLFIVFCSVFTAGIFSQDEKTLKTLVYNINSIFPKIIICLLLYKFYIIKGVNYFIESIKFSGITIPYILISINIYFIFFSSNEIEWGITVIRRTLEGSDPNEFASLLVILCIFSFFNIISSKNIYLNIISASSLLLTIYSIIQTYSRGGLIVLIFSTISFYLFFLSKKTTKVSLIIIAGLYAIIIMIQSGFIDVFLISERFFGRFISNTASLTANRTELLIAGFKGFIENPILGYGNSIHSSYLIAQKYSNFFDPLHNTFLEILIRLGLFGFTAFILMIYFCTKTITINFFKIKLEYDHALLIPCFCLLVTLFAGLSLTWNWKEIMWYLIGISAAASKLIIQSEK